VVTACGGATVAAGAAPPQATSSIVRTNRARAAIGRCCLTVNLSFYLNPAYRVAVR
jgi:hypothetical protein